MGVKPIVSCLNRNEISHRGSPFYTGTVHAILTRETYAGMHYYNQHDSRTRKPRPKTEWVAITVPAIVSRKQFAQVQSRLHERRSTTTPPRIVTSGLLLSGLARCEFCSASLMLRTGKSGRYRYYVCAS